MHTVSVLKWFPLFLTTTHFHSFPHSCIHFLDLLRLEKRDGSSSSSNCDEYWLGGELELAKDPGLLRTEEDYG